MTQFKDIELAYMRNQRAEPEDRIDIISLYQTLEDKSIQNDKEENLYHLAARQADAELIKKLLLDGVKVCADNQGNTPLHALVKGPLVNMIRNIVAKEQEIYDIVKLLVEAKVNPKKKNDMGEIAYLKGGKALMYPMIEALADLSVKMNAIGEESKNLLHIVCSFLAYKKNESESVKAIGRIVKALLRGGIDPEDQDLFGTTPLVYAQRAGVNEIASLFSDEGKVEKTAGMTIHQAVLYKNIPVLEALVETDCDLNEPSEEGKTPLMIACEYPSLDIVKILLKKDVDINYKSGENGHTAIFFLLNKAIHNLNVGVAGGQDSKIILQILRALIESGLNVDETIDEKGNTALNVLCGLDYLAGLNNQLAEELIDADCNVNLPNLLGKTPLMTFAEQGNEPKYNIAELLLDNDADVELVDQKSCTALMYAASNKNAMSAKVITELILDVSADNLEKTNNAGETAMDIAVNVNNEAVVKLLLNNM